MAIVYRARNIINNKLYIGYTSRSLSYRKSGHTQALNKGVDTKFYRAVRKYGKENFKWKILARGNNADMLIKEKQLIEEFDSIKNGYNTVAGGKEGNTGYKWTKRQRINCSIAQKKRFQNKTEIEKNRKRTLDWIKNNPDKHKDAVNKRAAALRKEDYRKRAAEKQREYARNNPDAMLIKGRKQSNFYKENPEAAIEVSRKLGGRPIKVYDYDTDKYIKTFPTQHDAARKLGVGVGNIYSVLHGKRNHAGGYSFKYKTA